MTATDEQPTLDASYNADECTYDFAALRDYFRRAVPYALTHATGSSEPKSGAPFPNRTPRTVTVGGVQVDHRLYYSETVRSWARENGMQVSGSGKMPRSVVEAYVAAFPQAAV